MLVVCDAWHMQKRGAASAHFSYHFVYHRETMLVTERDVCATRPEIGRRFPLYAVEGFLHDVSVNEFALIITRIARLTLLVRVKVIKL